MQEELKRFVAEHKSHITAAWQTAHERHEWQLNVRFDDGCIVSIPFDCSPVDAKQPQWIDAIMSRPPCTNSRR